jgi:DNA-directed RNA polymerase specialized sigma24 family protein
VLRATTERLAALEAEKLRLSRERQEAVGALRAQGLTYAEIGELAGLTRARIEQIHKSRQ